MSTLKVTNIQNPSTSSGGVSIDTSGHVTVDGVAMPSAGPLSNRNLVINGAMQVAQRGTQVTGETSGGYQTCDRFKPVITTLGTWTISQSTDSPDGFSYSLKLDCTTADASPASADVLIIKYQIEAQDLQHLKYGTSSAETMTLSFWVKSNKTGDASIDFRQTDNSGKLYTVGYSISAANTWEQKVLTITGDTAGVINNDSETGLEIDWWLNSGSNFTGGAGPSNSWFASDNTRRNFDNFGLGGSTDDEFYITGVQLEVGSVATPFEHRSFGDELLRCQRYYFKTIGSFSFVLSNGVYNSFQFPVRMRVTPTVTLSGGGSTVSGTDADGFHALRNGTNNAHQVTADSAEL